MKQVQDGKCELVWIEKNTRPKRSNKATFQESTKEVWKILDVYKFDCEQQPIPEAWKV